MGIEPKHILFDIMIQMQPNCVIDVFFSLYIYQIQLSEIRDKRGARSTLKVTSNMHCLLIVVDIVYDQSWSFSVYIDASVFWKISVFSVVASRAMWGIQSRPRYLVSMNL